MADEIWSNTDFPYACLIDKKRTLTFKKAILATVKAGDTVVDVGAGSGILSFFAAEAGAKKVYALEIDGLLAASLKKSVKQNSLEGVIEVIEGNVMATDLPKDVDVVIAELIETGLLDEMQVEVMNHLHTQGTIGSKTKVIPRGYGTSLQLVELNNEFYGYHIAAPIHNWPNYSTGGEGWQPLRAEDASDIQKVGYFDFQSGTVQPEVSKVLEFKIAGGKKVNAVKLMGVAHLTDQVLLDACNSFSGDKILPLDIQDYHGTVKLKVEYKMGAGLSNIKISRA